jgi:hypothetical protein
VLDFDDDMDDEDFIGAAVGAARLTPPSDAANARVMNEKRRRFNLDLQMMDHGAG